MKVLFYFVDHLLGKLGHCSKIKAFLARILEKMLLTIKKGDYNNYYSFL